MNRRNTARDWGEPLWRALPRVIFTGPLPRTADVVVVGAGLTGVSAALHLARGGLSVVILEAAGLGEGASGRTGGIVLEGTAVGIRPGADNCVPSLARLVEQLGIDCDLHLPGCWEIEHQAGSGGSELPWHDDNHPISIARTVPGGSVEPRALLFGLAETAERCGATLKEYTPVRKIRLSGPAVEIDEGVIAARHVVVAVNAWTSALLPGLPRIHSALTYACATEPLPHKVLDALGLGEHIPFYTADRPYLWGRLARDGEVVFGAGLMFGAPRELEREKSSSDDSRRTLTDLADRVRQLNPALARVRIPFGWTGPIAFTDKALPVIATYPPNPAVVVAGAYAGHGVAFSVHAGASIARLILNGSSLPEWGAIL